MAFELLDTALQVRMAATAGVVVVVSWAVGAFGPWIGGALAGLPMVLGPAFFFLIQQSPPEFVAHTATYTLLALSATQLFLLAYILAARRARPLPALGFAIAAWAAVAAICRQLPPRPGLGLLAFLMVTTAAMHASAGLAHEVRTPPGRASWLVLLFRGVLAGVLVAGITTAAGWLGAASAGVLLAFPVGYTVIATTVHEKLGAASAIATLRSALVGSTSLAIFSVLMVALPERLPPWWALAVATLGSVCVTLGLVLRSRRRGRSDLA